LQPPENRFSSKPFSFPSSIWTSVCTIWEISGARPLFRAFLPTLTWFNVANAKI
ncbi:hypothetical protein BO79DRAFT_162305, partial [Aspergillus costaricaensis CBS 115574]